MHKIIIFNRDIWQTRVLIVNPQNYAFIFTILSVYENINIFLSNDHIWNYRNLNSHISQTHLGILFKFSGFSTLIDFFKTTEVWKIKL